MRQTLKHLAVINFIYFLFALCENLGEHFCKPTRKEILEVTSRSLGLRRHTIAPAATIQGDQPVPYGMHRGLPRRPAGPFSDFGLAEKVVDEAPAATVVEFIEAQPESDVVIAGIETVVPAPAPAPLPHVDPHPGFFAYEGGELIPESGPYTSLDGAKWMHGVPAFLHETRPVSNIR